MPVTLLHRLTDENNQLYDDILLSFYFCFYFNVYLAEFAVNWSMK